MGFEKLLGSIDDIVWGPPLLIILMFTGLLLTFRLKFLQVSKLPLALKYMFMNEDDGVGDVTSFGALCTALAATVGTGNIVGVATAVKVGGPGALFWMWMAAFFGMATKYAEGLLAVKYRQFDENGQVLGGPFYYIEKGMGSRFKWLAYLFAFFGAAAAVMGIGTMVQVNGIADSIKTFAGENAASHQMVIGTFHAPWVVVITALIVTFVAGLVIIGGIKRIAQVSEYLVPFMAVFYVAGCLFIIILNIDVLPQAFGQIIKGAFSGTAATGGFLGAGVMLAIQKGIARGVFSNEAGLGSAPIAAAAAKTKWPARQGLVSMTGTFTDTIVICTMTGLVLTMTGSWMGQEKGAAMTGWAFEHGLSAVPVMGQWIVTLGLIFFAFTTILGWSYYGEKCMEYLVGAKSIIYYRWIYITTVLIGPFLSLGVVWTLADIFNGMMALPNLIALIALNGVVVAETKKFFDYLKADKKGVVGKNLAG